MTRSPDERASIHKRRPRYRGTHPRRFEDKYKERAPEQYPELIAHLRERGQTPAGQHVPILVDEVLEALEPASGERGVDATLGWGGHAEAILRRLHPGGALLALDADPIELPRAEARLRSLGFDEAGWHEGVEFVFADLGVSSMQIDDPARGFSFKADGPLDMRMNPKRGLSAAQWLERASLDTLTAVLTAHSDEPHAAHIASALSAHQGTLTTTGALGDAVRSALEGRAAPEDVDLAVRRVFQALRIEVNDEFGALDAFLRQLPACLRPGGRAAVLTFHSGEDRRVKKSFASGLREGVYARVSDDVVRATPSERRSNPRASSAKLRCAVRAR